MKRLLLVLLFLVILLLGLTFAMQNQQPLQLDLLVFSWTQPSGLVVTLALFCGLLLGALLSTFYYLPLRWRYLRVQKQLQRLQPVVEPTLPMD